MSVKTFRLPIVAGWSSLVARQAHNLKVVGSNPTPAPNLKPSHCSGGLFVERVTRFRKSDHHACDMRQRRGTSRHPRRSFRRSFFELKHLTPENLPLSKAGKGTVISGCSFQSQKGPPWPLGRRAVLRYLFVRLCDVLFAVLGGLHAHPCDFDDLPKRVAPCSRDDFHRMEEAILGHPPDRSPAHAEELRGTLLGHKQLGIHRGLSVGWCFKLAVD